MGRKTVPWTSQVPNEFTDGDREENKETVHIDKIKFKNRDITK